MVEISRFLDELYAVPPKDFTRARNAKAAELTAAGHADDAKAVRQLGKPSASLWATNQLARLDPERVAHFVDLVQQTRRTQLRDPRAAAEAMRAQRVELEALTTAAAEAMTKAGYPVSRATRGRVSDTLLGAAVDGRLADELRGGRLTSELSAPGFEIFAGATAGAELRLGPAPPPADRAQRPLTVGLRASTAGALVACWRPHPASREGARPPPDPRSARGSAEKIPLLAARRMPRAGLLRGHARRHAVEQDGDAG